MYWCLWTFIIFICYYNMQVLSILVFYHLQKLWTKPNFVAFTTWTNFAEIALLCLNLIIWWSIWSRCFSTSSCLLRLELIHVFIHFPVEFYHWSYSISGKVKIVVFLFSFFVFLSWILLIDLNCAWINLRIR